MLVDSQGYLDTTLLTNPRRRCRTSPGPGPPSWRRSTSRCWCSLFSVPIGIATAIYLEEFADKERWYNRLLELNIQNLAGVPSIVYGILGLAFLVRGPRPRPTLLAGALILTLLVLPTVIIASREALRSVPPVDPRRCYALGATPWQVTWRQVLPAAVPGIATGSILALSRAIGETAPLLLVGAVTTCAFDPTLNGASPRCRFRSINWISRPQEEFKLLAAAAIVVLLVDAAADELRSRSCFATATRRDGEMDDDDRS